MITYFAYGSNLDVEQMRERVGFNSLPMPAQLSGYKLVFDKYSINRHCGVANLRYTGIVTDTVEGLVYQLNAEQLATLDRFEGFRPSRPSPTGYRRQEVSLTDGTTAITYIAPRGDMSLKPSVAYLQHFLKGKNALSPDYYGAFFRLPVNDGNQLRDHLPQKYLEYCVEHGKQLGILHALANHATLTTQMLSTINSPAYRANNPLTIAALQPYLDSSRRLVL
ncbi:gamma-glutamylcyclotransferase [Candidatus Berkiella aquae]|uniref:AIG2-like family protein n=1 Tax=Candidatus Berkiella aquae TaxID=295108 RepID=A0A0Q9YR31_9GAMM|nr:gamma-glutamylcyclotransferase family protein [Candidatus Berkiella aquae]MCS5709884.1 gamma-glutamylcyclotransferase [Candidatus Berkiella aquae]